MYYTKIIKISWIYKSDYWISESKAQINLTQLVAIDLPNSFGNTSNSEFHYEQTNASIA
jgi:hypothetical protein